MISDYVIPVIIISLVIFCMIERKSAYSCFTTGVKRSIDLVITTLPYIVTVFIMIEILNKTLILDCIVDILSPALNVLGIPAALVPLIVIKMLSGSGGIACYESIINTFGVDSEIGRAAAIIAASSEAVFFCASLYFAGTKVTKFRYAIPVCIICNILCAVLACAIVKIL